MKRYLITLIMIVAASTFLPLPCHGADGGQEAGGIHIHKTDITGNPLEGAEFSLLRPMQEEEAFDRDIEKKMVTIGEENKIMVVETFWNDRAMTGKKQKEVVTDRQGSAALYGLPWGTYYLLETKAPEGYNRITEPIRITIHKYSHLTESDKVRDDEGKIIDNTLQIINVRYTLPDTGNLGTLQLTAAGMGILFSSVSLILLNRRRWQ